MSVTSFTQVEPGSSAATSNVPSNLGIFAYDDNICPLGDSFSATALTTTTSPSALTTLVSATFAQGTLNKRMSSHARFVPLEITRQIGLGTRTNPYDLRSGFALCLQCQTTCGYPSSNIHWFLSTKNVRYFSIHLTIMTSSSEFTSPPSRQEVSTKLCDSTEKRNMTTTLSRTFIHCGQLDLIGLNQIYCRVNGTQYLPNPISASLHSMPSFVAPDTAALSSGVLDSTLQKQIYVLCPDRLISGVDKPEAKIRFWKSGNIGPNFIL
ncbi:unnamed protein product [Protopolystoma xenopodis]|uniref:Uncharacterized protein n=1 Tax=Protopolystoma xenopodis TaxID=117903 RepID=A0A3S5FBN9_9PLAT|nr:unnamed protein product [Protopolystoma xenopodis]